MKLVKTGRLYIGCLSLLAPAFVFAQTPITTNESPESHAKTQQDSSFWGSFTDQVKQTWDADNYELYVPLNTWHNRAMYATDTTNALGARVLASIVTMKTTTGTHCMPWRSKTLTIKLSLLSAMVLSGCGSPGTATAGALAQDIRPASRLVMIILTSLSHLYCL